MKSKENENYPSRPEPPVAPIPQYTNLLHPTITVKREDKNYAHTSLMTIRKDEVKTIEFENGSRNLYCRINGIKVFSGYDSIIKELNWDTSKVIP